MQKERKDMYTRNILNNSLRNHFKYSKEAINDLMASLLKEKYTIYFVIIRFFESIFLLSARRE